MSILALCAVGALVLLSTILIIASSTTRPSNPDSLAIWREHRTACLARPGESYRHERFRAIKGRVTDDDGKPLADATVRCSRVVDLASVGELTDAKWAVLIVADVQSDSEGRYNFPHLPVGAYTFFYSSPGFGPAIKDCQGNNFPKRRFSFTIVASDFTPGYGSTPMTFSPGIAHSMRMFHDSLSEKDRRRHAAIEAAKLGYGGTQVIADLLDCDPKTIP